MYIFYLYRSLAISQFDQTYSYNFINTLLNLGSLLDPRVKKMWIDSSGLNEEAVLNAAKELLRKRYEVQSN